MESWINNKYPHRINSAPSCSPTEVTLFQAATWNNFTTVYSMEAKDFLWRGEPLYTNVKAPHGTWTFWVKEIDQACLDSLE